MQLTILTYNIHKCIGGIDRRYDPERICQTISHYDPDIACLQEVDNLARRSNRDRQVDVLGDRLGYRYRTWFANVKVRGGGEYGNAILSRFPLIETNNIDLTIRWHKRRSVLHASYRVPIAGSHRSRTVHVFNMHLGLMGGERKLQLRRFLDCHPFRGVHKQTPVLVAGDFNDVWGTLGKKLLHPAGFRGMDRPLRTFPSYAPVRALDSVYVKGDVALRKIQRSRLAVARRASDHLPLIAELELT